MSEMERYAAIDFETMDSFRSSVCSVGVVIIEDGKIVDTFQSLVRPNTNYENPFCTRTHGITLNECKAYPEFPEIWEKVDKMIDGCKIIAHNVSFEKSCINACSEEFGTNNDYSYIDTLKLSRKCLNKLSSHKLNIVCKYLNISLNKHHDALCDAMACARIFLKLRKNYDIENMI